ncbi:MAG: hypothetical protein JRI68_08875 [Deltaproteobacteria bacterium]|nr:hypothetical protein [Deltaproteobacteria bacterium]
MRSAILRGAPKEAPIAQPVSRCVAQVAILLALFALGGCNGCQAETGDPCKQGADCAEGQVCFDSTCLTQPAGTLRCRQGDRADSCSSLGLCTASKEGNCIAGSNDDCLRSGMCDKLGFCAAIGGHCAISAQQDADCQRKHGALQHNHCAFAGLCTAKGGECVAATDEDCKRAVVCTQDGSCTARSGKCTRGAKSRADCDREYGMLAHNPCAKEGRCTPNEEGNCVVGKDADCATTAGCQRRGLCTAKDGGCVAAKEADCRKSEACKELDLCVPQPEGTCAAAACRETRACTELGECQLVYGRCRATSESHCRKSTGCTTSGYCHHDAAFGGCLQKSADENAAAVADDGIILIISKSAILLGEEGEPVLSLPGREEQIRTGVAATSEGGTAGSLLIPSLAKRVAAAADHRRKRHLAKWRAPFGGTAEAVVVADPETPYRVVLEVLYTLGQSKVGRYHLMVMKRAGEVQADAGTPTPVRAPTPPPAGPPLEAIRGKKNLALAAHIDAAGITLRTSAGSIASGCNELGSSVTVPRKGERHDWSALASCLQRIKAVHPTDTSSVLSADYGIPYRVIIQLMDELRGVRGQELFPNTNFAFPRVPKEAP